MARAHDLAVLQRGAQGALHRLDAVHGRDAGGHAVGRLDRLRECRALACRLGELPLLGHQILRGTLIEAFAPPTGGAAWRGRQPIAERTRRWSMGDCRVDPKHLLFPFLLESLAHEAALVLLGLKKILPPRHSGRGRAKCYLHQQPTCIRLPLNGWI